MRLYEALFKQVLFPVYESVIAKRPSVQYIHEFEKHLSFSPDQLKEYQLLRFKKLLTHCYEQVPFYKDILTEIGIDNPQAEINSLDVLQEFPVMTKEMIKEIGDQLQAKQFKGRLLHKSTGGSTGQPFKFLLNHDSELQRNAVAIRGYNRVGAGLGVKTFYLWGTPLQPQSRKQTLKTNLYNWFYNRQIASSFSLSHSNIEQYITRLNHYRPDAIVGYTNPLYLLAKYALDHEIKLHQPKSIITGAEALSELQRSVIEQAFHCKTFNTYGCREVMLIGSECEYQSGFHLNTDQLIVETVNDFNNPIMNTSGHIVLTDLSNYAMPLIRYKNGDMGTLSQDKCHCGCSLPIMRSVDGRKLDILKTNDGKTVPGEFFPHLFKDFDSIKQFQVIQEDLSHLTIKLLTDVNFNESAKHTIDNAIKSVFGNSIQIYYDFVDKFELTPSGKFRVTISKV